MSRIAAGPHGCDVHTALTHVFDRAVDQLRRDPPSLVRRIDGDDVDDAHALVERVERDCRESDGLIVDNGDEDITLVARATRPHRFGLNTSPVRVVETVEDRIAQHRTQRGVDRLPRAKRELLDCIEVGLVERTDFDLNTHESQTLASTSLLDT